MFPVIATLIRLQRSITANNFTEEEFESRDNNQIPQDEKKKHADFIFSNNSTEDDLFKKAELFLLTVSSL